MGGIWSWNPIDWVLTPVKCALVWAFEPSEAATTSFTDDIGTAYSSTSVSVWLDALGGFGSFGGADTGAGCLGPGGTLPALLGGVTIHPFSTCSEPWTTMAGITKTFASLAVVWFCGASVMRHLAAGFGIQLDWGRRGASA
jgi:hypothetical protein